MMNLCGWCEAEGSRRWFPIRGFRIEQRLAAIIGKRRLAVNQPHRPIKA
jgi:hypothetical protein